MFVFNHRNNILVYVLFSLPETINNRNAVGEGHDVRCAMGNLCIKYYLWTDLYNAGSGVL